MKSVLKYFLIFSLVTFYIYSVKFTFLPFTAKQLIAMLGLFLFAFTRTQSYSQKSIVRMVVAALTIILWGFFTAIANGSNQFIYIHYIAISSLSCFFAAYCVLFFSKKEIVSITTLLRIVAFVVFFESILTIFIRLSPSVFNLFSYIQEFQFDEGHAESALVLYRFFGIGNAIYFGVLSSCALGTASCAYLMSITSGKGKYLYGFMLVVIIVVSFLVTRYSLLISVISLGLYFWNTSLLSFRNIVLMALVALLLYVLFMIATTYLPEEIVRWALSVFEKDSEENSTGAIVEWWTNTEFSLTTFLFGDGLYTQGGRYYKSVDIGYFRQIFYAGIIGLGLIIRYYWTIIKSTTFVIKDKQFAHFLISLFLCYIVSMAKGDLNMIDVFMLFFVFANYFFKPQRTL